MPTPHINAQHLQQLQRVLNSYHPLSTDSWDKFVGLCQPLSLQKHDYFVRAGDQPTAFAFVAEGLIRSYIIDSEGREYNKLFFEEGRFPGDMTALLTDTPARFNLQALEPTQLIRIDFRGFRELLIANDEVKLFHIAYLEKNWLLHKDAREVQLVQDDAEARYRRFLKEYPHLLNRIAQYHIASHIGVTPTQLSRIRQSFDNE